MSSLRLQLCSSEYRLKEIILLSNYQFISYWTLHYLTVWTHPGPWLCCRAASEMSISYFTREFNSTWALTGMSPWSTFFHSIFGGGSENTESNWSSSFGPNLHHFRSWVSALPLRSLPRSPPNRPSDSEELQWSHFSGLSIHCLPKTVTSNSLVASPAEFFNTHVYVSSCSFFALLMISFFLSNAKIASFAWNDLIWAYL